jgi:hypothetical protein
VLDMSMKIDEYGSFTMRVYCKTNAFPFGVISFSFLNSSINVRLCYLVFYGQVLRYQRLCIFRKDFADWYKMLAEKLIARGYNRGSLDGQFCKVVDKYSVEFQKWDSPVNTSIWFNQIHNPDLVLPNPQLTQLTQHGPDIPQMTHDNKTNNQPPVEALTTAQIFSATPSASACTLSASASSASGSASGSRLATSSAFAFEKWLCNL